jgi:hypothetical protein
VLHPRHWVWLIHEFICCQRVGLCRGEEIQGGMIAVMKVLLSVGEHFACTQARIKFTASGL